LARRQNEIEEKLDLTKNQAPSQAEADCGENHDQKNSEAQEQIEKVQPTRRVKISV
jgi:hypothetical protein